MDTNTQLPVRVLTSHEAWGIDGEGDVICVCGAKYPCKSRKQAAAAQLRTAALITAAMTVDYLRLIAMPRLANAAHRLHNRMFAWISESVAQQTAASVDRAWQATVTRAQRAVARVPIFRRNWEDGRITSGSGLAQIPRGEVRYGDVVGRGRVVPAGRGRG